MFQATVQPQLIYSENIVCIAGRILNVDILECSLNTFLWPEKAHECMFGYIFQLHVSLRNVSTK